MTVSVFASLPTAWPEYLSCRGGRGFLLAQIHPSAKRAGGEDDVLARALVFMPHDEIEDAHLRRLTIRYADTELDYEYLKSFPEQQSYAVARVEQFRRCLDDCKTLPVLDLHELCRTWPVELGPVTQ
ncbi:hypothetical protein XA26_31010 [Mycolicibacterium fortuitum]|uniref:Uncharacterized protein n=2 Tax=Mycolicibacterium fortuitum TaxID=1766 RepID=A0A0N9YBM2_MYCFO|nr:hypothetical protein XA26_31010 [Mycolicibacterium fortuitum]